jgi:hypothetical protein
VSQPYDRRTIVPAAGDLDSEYGAYWIGNPWLISSSERNLSSYERNRCFLNVNGSFVDVSYISGADSDSDARSVAVGDYNNDGKPDLFVRNAGGGPVQLFENRIPGGHWLKVSLRGRQSNALGVGARLVAQRGDGITLTRELFPADTFKSQSPHHVTFGLGSLDHVKQLAVFWPSGTKDVYWNVTADQHLRLVEGASQDNAKPAN